MSLFSYNKVSYCTFVKKNLSFFEIYRISILFLVSTKNVQNFSRKCPGSEIPGSCLLEALSSASGKYQKIGGNS
jgi:hypothetical protein